MTTKTMLATLALGAAIAFTGPAFADKMKATLDGKSQVPPNTSAGTGTADNRACRITEADHVIQARAADRLHEAILITTGNPDQGRRFERRLRISIFEVHLPRASGPRIEPHLHGAVAGILQF